MKLSKRISEMQESPVRKLVPIAENTKKKGIKVYHLNIGQPDILTPEGFMKRIKAYDNPVIAYSFSQGEPELINAIVDYYKDYHISFDPSDILITNGGSEALLFAMIAVCDPDDEILVPEPFYTNYNGFGDSVNVKLCPITTKAEDGFHLPSVEEIEAKINERTKAIVFSNPGNPTGVIYTKDELDMIAALAKKHNLYVICDEVYREFTYDGLEFISMASYKEIEENVIVVDSVSKRYSACGARIGCIASKNKPLMANILKLCQGRLCVPTLEQLGACELYYTDKSYLENVNKEYNHRRNIVFDALSKMDNVICEKPTGAFYVIAKLPLENAEDFVVWLLEEFNVNNETVMLAPAEGFYATPGLGADEVRIAYVLEASELEKAMNILDLGLKAYLSR